MQPAVHRPLDGKRPEAETVRRPWIMMSPPGFTRAELPQRNLQDWDKKCATPDERRCQLVRIDEVAAF